MDGCADPTGVERQGRASSIQDKDTKKNRRTFLAVELLIAHLSVYTDSMSADRALLLIL